VERIHVVEAQEARAALEGLPGGNDATVVVSPLVERSLPWRLPEGRRRLSLRWRLAAGAVDRLRVELAYDVAFRRSTAPPSQIRATH
jgi:hypothetical protein